MMIDVLRVLSLFVAIWWSLINVFKLFRGEEILFWNIIFQTAGISAFVYLQWLM